MFEKPRYCGSESRLSHDTYNFVPTAKDITNNVLPEKSYVMNLKKTEYRITVF